MSKFTKLLLAATTVFPFLYMIFFMTAMFYLTVFASRDPMIEDGAMPALFMVIFPLHLLTMLLIMGLTVFYMVNVFRNERVDKDKKVLWAVVLFMGNMIAMPIYWYLYIWRDGGEAATLPNARNELNAAETVKWESQGRANEREKEYVPPALPPDWRD